MSYHNLNSVNHSTELYVLANNHRRTGKELPKTGMHNLRYERQINKAVPRLLCASGHT